ncbi:Ran binding domain [Macleaya cordata]|uniref:Ran binding domain n=1 Tax=Macleaya cordata TaxID=56857 RepID=A0A200R0A0_MACCD|nr:Ran binding domain [Macleaya cordata]
MKGMKRFAQSEPTPEANDNAFRSKRVMAGSPFDPNRAEPSREAAPLDVQRAESSRQHVRALNKQFASWVQSQLQHHPDELWEDGVQDYLTHASHIMEKFSDVVAWIKANAAKAENTTTVVPHGTEKKVVPEAKFQLNNNSVFGLVGSTFSHGTEKKLVPEARNHEVKFQLNNNSVFGQVGSAASFSSPWSSSLLSNSPSPILFGSQSLVSVNHEASNDADAEDELEQPSSPSVKKTEEKGITVVHEVKCKLYVKSTDPADKEAWKDKGMGQLSIRCKEGVSKATKESKPTIIVRNDVGKVLLNALLYPGIKTNLLKNAIAAIFHTSGDADGNNEVVARTYLLRTKTEEERNTLASAIQEYAPVA